MIEGEEYMKSTGGKMLLNDQQKELEKIKKYGDAINQFTRDKDK